MKLFEAINLDGISISQAIKDMVQDMFQQELDEEQAEAIAKGLSLSDIIALDSAYTNWQKEEVLDIIGPLPQMEYSMGGGAPKATSSASERPAPGRRDAPAANKKPGSQNTTQTNRAYSGGVQNGVTTQNTDMEDDPDAMQGQQEITEEPHNVVMRAPFGATDVQIIYYPRRNSYRVYAVGSVGRAIGDLDQDFGDMEDAMYHAEMGIENEFGKELDWMDVNENNVVEMVEWLKKRAGIE